VHGADLIALLDKIDNKDPNNNNPEENHIVNQLASEMRRKPHYDSVMYFEGTIDFQCFNLLISW